MTELQEKIARLPTWAREHILRLEDRPRLLADECATLRRKVESLEAINKRYKDRIEAMVAMFQCAAKSGNEVAQAVQRIVEDFLVSDED